MDSWYGHGLMVLTTPMVLTQTHSIVSVLLNHTYTRGPSDARMHLFLFFIIIKKAWGHFPLELVYTRPAYPSEYHKTVPLLVNMWALPTGKTGFPRGRYTRLASSVEDTLSAVAGRICRLRVSQGGLTGQTGQVIRPCPDYHL